MGEIQRVFLQQKGMPGKFVQLMIQTEEGEIPIFASKEKPCLHAEVLSGVLDNLSLNYSFSIDNLNGGIKIPKSKGENYRIVGAGELKLGGDKKTLIITRNSYSGGYNVWFNEQHLEQVRSYFPRDLELLLS